MKPHPISVRVHHILSWPHATSPCQSAAYRRSAGLLTPRPPRLSTCVYIIVVLTSVCPRSSCTVRMSYPASRRCVANEWRHSSSHCSSFVDGPDLVLAPSLLRTNRGDCPMVTAPDLGESRRQAS